MGKILGYTQCNRCYRSAVWRRSKLNRVYLAEPDSTQPHQCKKKPRPEGQGDRIPAV